MKSGNEQRRRAIPKREKLDASGHTRSTCHRHATGTPRRPRPMESTPRETRCHVVSHGATRRQGDVATCHDAHRTKPEPTPEDTRREATQGDEALLRRSAAAKSCEGESKPARDYLLSLSATKGLSQCTEPIASVGVACGRTPSSSDSSGDWMSCSVNLWSSASSASSGKEEPGVLVIGPGYPVVWPGFAARHGTMPV